MHTPWTEGLVAFLALLTLIAVLGLAWLVYLGKGGKPFSISIKGLGLSVSVTESERRKSSD